MITITIHISGTDSDSIVSELHQMRIDLSELTADVQQTTSAEQSAVVLIQGIASQLADNASDQAAVAALAAQLKSGADGLASAMLANTPAAPAPAAA
jgi:hypothetical protein